MSRSAKNVKQSQTVRGKITSNFGPQYLRFVYITQQERQEEIEKFPGYLDVTKTKQKQLLHISLI